VGRDGERSYRQYCGVARALDLVGERWALLVVRELLLGPRRFTDLRAGLPGVSTNILAHRLKRLERAGIIARTALPAPAASTVYELTEYGRELEPILLALGRWGASSLGPRDETEVLRSHWLALALMGFFRPEAADGVSAEYEVRLRDGVFNLTVRDGLVEAAPGPAHAPELVLEADDDALIALLAGATDAGPALASGAVRLVEGDEAGLERFMRLFRFVVPAVVG
jgi:DNA-binding HxlR family transcriptional regulator